VLRHIARVQQISPERQMGPVLFEDAERQQARTLRLEVRPLTRSNTLSTRSTFPRRTLISSGKTCAATLTGNCSSSRPRRTSKPSWQESEQQLKPGLAVGLGTSKISLAEACNTQSNTNLARSASFPAC
jgi:hypothetical protein